MDFNRKWRRELRFNVVMLGLSSLACIVTALLRDPNSVSNERPSQITQQVHTARVEPR